MGGLLNNLCNVVQCDIAFFSFWNGQRNVKLFIVCIVELRCCVIVCELSTSTSSFKFRRTYLIKSMVL